jgi:hypothetical protein
MVGNAEKNVEQRKQPKQFGGITGRGFLPGRSGNPSGGLERNNYTKRGLNVYTTRQIPKTGAYAGANSTRKGKFRRV